MDMTRRQRQSAKRARTKVAELEGRIGKLLDDMEYLEKRVRRAYDYVDDENRRHVQESAQLRQLMDYVAKGEMLRPIEIVMGEKGQSETCQQLRLHVEVATDRMGRHPIAGHDGDGE